MDGHSAATGSGDAEASTSSPQAPEDERAKQPTFFGWNAKRFGWKQWLYLGVLAAVLAVVIAVPIVVTEKNRYPDYSKLEYALTDTYKGVDFFDNFDFGNGTEATHGFTNYVTREGAAWSNLTYATANEAVIRVLAQGDTGNAGRPTVKIWSKNRYTQGLFIFDVSHVPYGCGTWPAIWMSDPDPDIWPRNGEIDIIEAVNQGNRGAQMALHTGPGCSMKVKRKQTGQSLSSNCLNSTNNNMGCAVLGPQSSYGEDLNVNGGGVYAMEWRTAGIRVWFFPVQTVPPNVWDEQPDPSTWPEATADFPSTKCPIDSHFKNHRIIINISLCGDWAGAPIVYNSEYGCPGNCTTYVGGNPEAFEKAYWGINSIKVYSAQNAN